MHARVLSLICCCLLAGCASIREHGELEPPPEIKNFTVGPWKNVHKKDPNLLGVRVQQFPDCAYEAPNYEGCHPAMIIYVFKDMRCHQMDFTPSGQLQEDFWWTAGPANPPPENLEGPQSGS